MSLNQKSWHLGEAFPVRVMALMLRDPEFLPKFHGDIEHAYFEKKDLCNLAYVVLKFFREREKVPNRDEVIDCIVEHAMTYDPDKSLGMEGILIQWLDFCLLYEIGDEGYIKEKIRKFAIRQRIKGFLGQAISTLETEKPDDPDEEVIGKLQKAWDDACRASAAEDLGRAFAEMGAALPQILRDSLLYGAKVPTGFPELDASMNGGLGVPELGVIAGPPNKGKSTVLSIFGANASRYFYNQHIAGHHPHVKTVVHITCEMIEEDIAAKYAANLTGMDIDAIPLKPQEYQTLYLQRAQQFGPVHIKYFPPGSTTVDEVKWYIANLVMAEGIVPGLIVLDYADRLKGGEDDRFTGMGRIYDQLIVIGNKFQCGVWTGSQINRAHHDQDIIGAGGLAESWKKYEAADTIITLCQNEDEENRSRMRFFTAKVKRGKKGVIVPCHFFPARCEMRQMTEEEVKAASVEKDGSSKERSVEWNKLRQQAQDGEGPEGGGAGDRAAEQKKIPGLPAAAFTLPNGQPGNVVAPAPPSVPDHQP